MRITIDVSDSVPLARNLKAIKKLIGEALGKEVIRRVDMASNMEEDKIIISESRENGRGVYEISLRIATDLEINQMYNKR